MKKHTLLFALMMFAITAVTSAQTVATTPPLTDKQVLMPVTTGAFINSLVSLETAPVCPAVFSPLISTFTCSASGRFPNPDNCHDYIFCIKIAGGGFQRRDYSCAAGSVFDVNDKVCRPEATASNPYPPCNN
jgi:hypothetical protein